MATKPSLTERISTLDLVTVTETFFRHAAPGRDAFLGGVGGRWGDAFPVIYLGAPEASVVVEAYRHLVEDAGVPAEHVKPRRLYKVQVRVSHILDLRSVGAQTQAGLTAADMITPVGDYGACQRVAAAAHQLRLHGILAPAAHGIGTTLALFRRNLPADEVPEASESVLWESLPPDPRTLRVVSRHESEVRAQTS
jgi:hypothetical protein